MADGSIMIEAKVSTDKFDKQIQKLDEKIQKKEKEKIKLEADIKNIKESEAGYDELIKKSDKYGDKLIQAKQKVEELINARKGLFVNGKIKASEIPQYENYGTQIEEAEAKVKELNTQIANTSKEISKWDNKLINNANKIETIKAKQAEVTEEVKKYKNQIESVKLQKQQAQVNNIKDGFDKMNKSVGNSIKHIGRLALGIFSVASAYRLMSAASSTLGQYDEQYAANLEYIRYLIAQAIAPALKYVVNLASTLLSYLNYILNAWFGITLFSKNSAKNFMKAKNSTGGISKNTGKIKKDLQTTPFDEMNVLSDTSSSGISGGAGGGAVGPSIDPSLLKGEVPDWLQWIVDHKDEILAVMTGVAAGLLAWKLGLEGIKALGIGLLIAGIVYTIESLLDYLKDPSWENFGKIIQGIGVAIVGLGLLIESVPVAVAGAIVLIIGTIVKYWEQIKAFFQKGIDWLRSKSDWIHEMFGDKIGDLYDFIVDILQNTLDSFDGLLSGIKNIFDGIIKFIKGVFTGDWKMAWDGIKQIFRGVFEGLWSIAKWPLNLIISGLNTLIRGANRIKFNVPDWVPGIGGKQFGFNIPQIPKLAKGTILNAPGRGVPVAGGRALAGEAGREAYLPLSDTQMLEELGSTIGKYITINANITNNMNGRVISRQLQQIRNDREFAYNGEGGKA